MKYKSLLLFLTLSTMALADTPPPGTVKAKTWSGDGNTAITATGSGLDVNVKNSITTTNTANGATGSAVPAQATQAAGVDGSGNLRALKVSSAGVQAVDASGTTVPVSGSFWQATQPVSGVFWQSLQPISGTVTANAGSGTFLVDGSASIQPVSGTFWQSTQPVSGTFWQTTQPISAASLPLPSGAATALKQPALGTAGTAATDVITVQGITSMTALKVDGSGATQPVSGTVTANAGTGTFTVDGSGHIQPVSGTFWQATQPVSGTFWQTTQPVSLASLPSLAAGSAVIGHVIVDSAPTTAVTGTVTANAGSNLNTSALALDTSVNGVIVGQASTTSGESGPLVQGATTTSAPTYTTAKTNPLSLTTAGALRTDASATTQPVSIATAPVLVAGSAIIGKVGIDQTTPGTTNGVQVNAALPAGSNVIGHVIVDTAPTTAVSQSGTWTVNSKLATPTAVTVKAAAVTIGTAAVRLTNDGSAPASTRVLLIAQLLSTSTANCFLGPSGVASSGASRGIQMFAGQSFSFNNDAGDYYAICDASSQTFFITEQE